MRSVKREAKGISPVIATILLIAVTAVAGGVIAAYVAGLYVGGGRVIIASADGAVYDYNETAALENYKNGVVSITIVLQPGSERIRSIAEAAYGGTIITVTNPTSGFSASVALPDNSNLWGSQITAVNTVPVSAWVGATDDLGAVLDNANVRMEVVMTPDTQGRLSAGALISITLQPFSNTDAHAIDNTGDYRTNVVSVWDELQTFNVTISGRDPVSLTGFDGAYLMGTSWVD